MDKHNLHTEFPAFDAKITELKVSDNHFKKLYEEYNVVNNEIHRIETGAEATTDAVLNDLRLKRVHLKDEVYNILNK